jgi:DNA ligase 1
MRRFAALYRALDESTSTLDKRAALIDYFSSADPADAAWALALLSGAKLRRVAASGELREWISAEAGMAPWLVDDAYAHVGDLAETVTLLLQDPPPDCCVDRPLSTWIEDYLLPVAKGDVAVRREAVVGAWRQLAEAERFVFNKLLTGALRVGVSQRSVQQALAELSGIDIALIAQRMMGAWTPTPAFIEALLSPEITAADRAQPYPFFLASPLETPAAALGDPQDWLIEWKWDGIRLQLLRRDGEVALWSRGEERLDGRFPEIELAAMALPEGTVLDGELLAWDSEADRPAPFTALQKRINRLKPSVRLQQQVPVRLLAYDLLEEAGEDLRARPLGERRARLQVLAETHADPRIAMSPRVELEHWHDAEELLAGARAREVEGLMLKRLESAYQVGRRRGDWWKWKVDPLTIDAVLIYAQSGSGRRSTLFTDYTFALWDGDLLVPVAKAYSGLDDKEILRLDRWIRANTVERFGPVRSVQPVHVFELGFEAVNLSTRHKSGVAVRFPRILRWRSDKPAQEADRLHALKALAR